nr:tRNA:m(4)X modification enzyme TRM13 homolog [Procambarus clarkii]XP_045603340.1 tRNA:m(4)X modification enzyme TRM13 homolog [Procambarus clarkii]XP_045603341.1 tRNA:m(4)X modification enzyme TRM13 homolog [Procambarus clarkii]
MEQNKTCRFYVKRKKRYCKMLVKVGQHYCGQHLVEEHLNGEKNQFKRIPCPLDPKHSCFEHRLEHHLAICNAREKTGLSYVSRNINLRDGVLEEPPRIPLSSLTDPELLSLIAKVEAVHKENVGNIKESVLSHASLEKEITTPGYGPSVVRHLSQNSSILGHLESVGLLNTSTIPTCFVEFGAGRGQLTNWLTEAVSDTSKALFVLVDKGAQRYKFDAKLRYNSELSIQRLRVDIQHLNLEGVASLDTYDRIVGLGKHLCGGATDLALHCLSRYSRPVVAGLVLALCCHHRCTWLTYSGFTFLSESGFSSNEFYTLTALTSWATCNSKDIPSKENVGDIENLQENDKDYEHSERDKRVSDVSTLMPQEDSKNTPSEDNQLIENRYTRLNLSAQYREEVGRKAKQLLDYGRVKYLCDQGFQCHLVQYVSKEKTLENIALVANFVGS